MMSLCHCGIMSLCHYVFFVVTSLCQSLRCDANLYSLIAIELLQMFQVYKILQHSHKQTEIKLF